MAVMAAKCSPNRPKGSIPGSQARDMFIQYFKRMGKEGKIVTAKTDGEDIRCKIEEHLSKIWVPAVLGIFVLSGPMKAFAKE